MQQKSFLKYKETIGKFEEQIKKIEALDKKLKEQVKIHQDRSKLMITRSYKKIQEEEIKNLNIVMQSKIDREIQACIENGLKHTKPITQSITKMQDVKNELDKLMGQLMSSEQIKKPDEIRGKAYENNSVCHDGYSILVKLDPLNTDVGAEHNSTISNIEKCIFYMYYYITEIMEEFKNNDLHIE